MLFEGVGTTAEKPRADLAGAPHDGARLRAGKETMLWTLVVVLFILWLLGFSLSIGGGLIHILLVVALVILVFNLVSGRRGAV